MTTPDHTALDAAVAAYEAAVAADDASRDVAYAAAQQQLAKLQANYDTDQTEIADLEAQVADLQAKLDALQPPAPEPSSVIYGSGFGGWFQRFSVTVKGKTYNTTEQKQAAYGRVVAAYGTLKVARLFGSIPSYLDPATRLFWDTGDSRPSDAQRKQLNDRGPGQLLSFAHEVDLGKGYTPASFAAAQNAEAQYLRDNGYDNITLVPLLTGGSGIPARQGSIKATDWFAGIDWTQPNVQPGADWYQWAKSDSDADSAEEVFGPWADIARMTGKRLVGGEDGTRRVNPPYSPGISDGARVKYINDSEAYCAANRDAFEIRIYFNSNNGGLAPWNLIAPPGCPDADYSPQANAAWTALCKR
jgi:hypothetical protein